MALDLGGHGQNSIGTKIAENAEDTEFFEFIEFAVYISVLVVDLLRGCSEIAYGPDESAGLQDKVAVWANSIP